MLRDSTAVVAVVVRTRPRAIPVAMVHMRKSIHGFPSVPYRREGSTLLAADDLSHFDVTTEPVREVSMAAKI